MPYMTDSLLAPHKPYFLVDLHLLLLPATCRSLYHFSNENSEKH
jgi:hypothetical protein